MMPISSQKADFLRKRRAEFMTEKKLDNTSSSIDKQSRTKESKASTKKKALVDQAVLSKQQQEVEWRRTTLDIRAEYAEKLKALSFIGNLSIKDIVDKIFDNFFSSQKDLFPTSIDFLRKKQAELIEELFKETSK